MNADPDESEIIRDLVRLSYDEKKRLEVQAQAMQSRLHQCESDLHELQQRLKFIQAETVSLRNTENQSIESNNLPSLSSASTSQLLSRREKRSHGHIVGPVSGDATFPHSTAPPPKKPRTEVREPPPQVAQPLTGPSRPTVSSQILVQVPPHPQGLVALTNFTKPGPSKSQTEQQPNDPLHRSRSSVAHPQLWRPLQTKALELLAELPGSSTFAPRQPPHSFINSNVPQYKIHHLLQKLSGSDPRFIFEVAGMYYDPFLAEQDIGKDFVVVRPAERLTSTGRWVQASWLEDTPVSLIGKPDRDGKWKYFGQYKRRKIATVDSTPQRLFEGDAMLKFIWWIQSCCMPWSFEGDQKDRLEGVIASQYSQNRFIKGMCLVGYRYVGWSKEIFETLVQVHPQ